jgi:hypothetical protein
VDDSCHNWRVPSKWKGVQKGSKGNQQGEQRGSARGARGKRAMCICNCNVYVRRMVDRLNDIAYRVHNNNNRNECC